LFRQVTTLWIYTVVTAAAIIAAVVPRASSLSTMTTSLPSRRARTGRNAARVSAEYAVSSEHPRCAAWQLHIEYERKRLRQAHAVLACLSETLAHSDTADGVQHADVVDVATDLLAAAIERLDLVVLRAVREQVPSYYTPLCRSVHVALSRPAEIDT